MMIGQRVGLAACFLLAALFALPAAAQVSGTTGAQAFPASTYAQWVMDIDFGATAHSEALTLTITNTAAGFRVEMTDCTGSAAATTNAEWNARNPVWDGITTPAAPGTYNLTIGAAPGVPYATPSLSGQHRFFFNIVNGLTANTLTFTATNGGAATATLVAAPGFFTPTANPPTGTPAPITGTASTGFVEHSIQQVFGISTLGAAVDQVAFNMDVNFGATAQTLQVSLRAVVATGTNQVIFDLYSLADDGGGTPSATMTITAQAGSGTADCKTFTTGSYSGSHKFRVVLRAGTPFSGSLLTNFFVTWSKLPTLGTAPAGAPGVAKSPVVAFTAGSPAAGALPAGTGGTAYATQTIGGQGGSGTPAPTTWLFTVSAGSLPPGLTLTPATAAATATLAGTPTAAGTFNFTVRVSNSATGFTEEWAQRAYSIVVTGVAGPTLTVVGASPVNIPTTVAGTAGTPGSFTVNGSSLTPLTGSVTLTLTTGAADFQFRDATAGGAFATTPVTINYTLGAFTAHTIEVRFGAAATAGAKTGSVTVSGGGATSQVVNLAGTVTAVGVPVIICNPTTVVIPTTNAGTAGVAATYVVSASSLTPANGNITLALTGGPGIEYRNLTAGGTFGTGNVTIAYTGGTLAAQSIEVRFAASATAGAKTGSIGHTGGGATAVNVPLSGTVNPAGGGALTISTGTLANGTVGTVYSGPIASTGGTGPFTWSLSAGALPGGLTLNTASTASTTAITGTPTAAGTFNFTVRIQDSTAAFDIQAYTVTINPVGSGGTTTGGGGGGGGCASDSNNTSWFLLAGLAGMLLVALRSRRRAA